MHLNMDLGNGNNGDEMSENDDDGIVSSYFKCHLCDEVGYADSFDWFWMDLVHR